MRKILLLIGVALVACGFVYPGDIDLLTQVQIDGGSNYYANEGCTNAHANGWDNPTYFTIGAWAAPIVTTADGNRWATLGWNTAWVPAGATLSVIQAHNYQLVISDQGSGSWPSYTSYSFTPGAESTIVETFDEPSSMANFYNGMSTLANSIQDPLCWWVNNTINWDISGSPTTSGQQGAALAALQTTPSGKQRHIDVSSIDLYPFTRNDAFGPVLLKQAWGLPANATPDQYRRGFWYGDMIDQERAYMPKPPNNQPIMAFIDNGGPFTTNTTNSSYIQPYEMNWGIWQSLIHGARGIIYFNNTFGGNGISSDDMNTAFFQSPQTEATFTGTGSGTSLTVSAVTGQIFLGDVITGTGVPANTTIVSQSSGTNGGAGVYVTNNATTSSSAALTDSQPISIFNETANADLLVTQLAPVLNSPFFPSYASVSPASAEVIPTTSAGTAALTGIDIAVKWYSGGNVTNDGLALVNGAYIFASTRMSEYATNISATFTLRDAQATSVNVVGESRTITVTGGVFTDTFATAATIHIYQVNG